MESLEQFATMVNFLETEEKLNLKQIQDIELFIGLTFPDQYIHHLLKYNGGRCEPNIFSFYENEKLTNSRIDWFLAIFDGEYDNLKEYLKDYKIDEKRMPKSFIPIANDPFGNLICIDTTNAQIYFWDHENEIDYTEFSDEERSNLSLIADSFDEFIASLREK